MSADEKYICKECSCIISEIDVVKWTAPTSPNKVACLLGHPQHTPKYASCKTGVEHFYEEYSTGQLMLVITREMFLKFNYLGKMDWYTFPIDFLNLVDGTEQTLAATTKHSAISLAVEDLGEVTVNLPDARGKDPYGLDIFIRQSNTNGCVKIVGGPYAIWMKARSHHVVYAWCGDVMGWLISSGNYSLVRP
jgi:hypothetical protein